MLAIKKVIWLAFNIFVALPFPKLVVIFSISLINFSTWTMNLINFDGTCRSRNKRWEIDICGKPKYLLIDFQIKIRNNYVLSNLQNFHRVGLKTSFLHRVFHQGGFHLRTWPRFSTIFLLFQLVNANVYFKQSPGVNSRKEHDQEFIFGQRMTKISFVGLDRWNSPGQIWTSESQKINQKPKTQNLKYLDPYIWIFYLFKILKQMRRQKYVISGKSSLFFGWCISLEPLRPYITILPLGYSLLRIEHPPPLRCTSCTVRIFSWPGVECSRTATIYHLLKRSTFFWQRNGPGPVTKREKKSREKNFAEEIFVEFIFVNLVVSA